MLFERKDVNYPESPVTHVLIGTNIENIFTPGKCIEGAVVDYIIDGWLGTSEQYKTGERVLLSPDFIKVRTIYPTTFDCIFVSIDFSHYVTTYCRMCFKFV